MSAKRFLFFAVIGTGFLLIVLRAEKPFGQSPMELTVYGISVERDFSGRLNEVSIVGSGFDGQTRLFLTPDFGNRQALLKTLPTGGNLQSVTVAGNLAYLANHYRGMQVFDFSEPG